MKKGRKQLKKTKIEDKKSWDKDDYIEDVSSAREMPLGYIIRRKGRKYQLHDKFLCKINVCYHCKSENTYHRRQQILNDIIGNVWEMTSTPKKRRKNEIVTKKYDLCLDCGKMFLIEYFAFARVKDKTKLVKV